MVIGVGNEYRRDDGFGPTVVARLAELQRADARPADLDLAVSGCESGFGTGLTPEVSAAVEPVLTRVRELVN